MTFELHGRCIVEGFAEGRAIVTRDGISFMGTVNPKTGQVIEYKHELEGEYLEGKILCYPKGKGSTGGSYMLYDLVKNKKGPMAIVNVTGEQVTVVGAIVAELPMVDGIDISQIHTGDWVEVLADEGIVRITRDSEDSEK